MNRQRVLTIAFGALVAAAIAGGVAYATIPGAGNVYSACMLKGVGTIRLIDKSLPATNAMSRCTDKETEVSWNQAGQPGPQGPEGAKGEPGANGTNGTNGKDGEGVTTASEPAGARCAAGGVQLTAANNVSYVCNGERGPQGDRGLQGEPGVQGPRGDAGQTGPPGPPGAKGDTGDAGPAGLGSCIAETVTLHGGTNGANLITAATSFSSLIAELSPTLSSSNGSETALCGGTLSNLRVTVSDGNAPAKYLFTVRVNDGATPLSCIHIDGTGSTCTDTTHVVTLLTGDSVNLSAQPTGGTPVSATWSASYARKGASGL